MFLLALLAAAATPKPADLKTFGDWTVGCDNGRACHAVALIPEDWPEDASTMSVRRGSEPGAQPEIRVAAEQSGVTALAVDGRKLAARLIEAPDDDLRVAPADVPFLLAALRSGSKIQLLGAKGQLGTISLAGASAALLYMDDQQKRIGTVTALVRPGPRPASFVPVPPPLPLVRTAMPPKGKGFAISPARIAQLRREAGCQIGEVGGPDSFEAAAIDPTHILVLLSCGSGAYNVTDIPFVATRSGGQVRIQLAAFDIHPSWWEKNRPTLINAGWDAENRLLVSFSKARGLGDCGTGSDFAWDGSRFRLVHQVDMDECRGSRDYITTWRAKVAQP